MMYQIGGEIDKVGVVLVDEVHHRRLHVPEIHPCKELIQKQLEIIQHLFELE